MSSIRPARFTSAYASLEAFVHECNEEMEGGFDLGILDIPDYDYASAYEAGKTVARTVNDAMEAAGTF